MMEAREAATPTQLLERQEHLARRARLFGAPGPSKPIRLIPMVRTRPAIVDAPAVAFADSAEPIAPALPVEQWPEQAPIVFYDVWDQSLISAQAIFAQVCAEFGVSKAELRGRSRKREKVAARRKAAYRIRTEVRISGRRPSLAEIGRIIGGFDHTTILYAIRAYEREQSSLATLARSVW